MYGTQASATLNPLSIPFENDVKMYGTQADAQKQGYYMGLRMM